MWIWGRIWGGVVSEGGRDGERRHKRTKEPSNSPSAAHPVFFWEFYFDMDSACLSCLAGWLGRFLLPCFVSVILFSLHSLYSRLLHPSSPSIPPSLSLPSRDMLDYIEDCSIHDPVPTASFGATEPSEQPVQHVFHEPEDLRRTTRARVFPLERQYDPGPARNEAGGMNKRP